MTDILDNLIEFSANTLARAADVNNNFQLIKSRFDDIIGGQFAQDADTTAALVFGYRGGSFRSDNVVSLVADGTVALTDAATNYVEVDASGVTANTSGFTSGKVALYEIITDDGVISEMSDKRAWASLGGGNNENAITNITGTSPISVTGTTTKNVSISPATTSAPGSMSAADKVKINSVSGNNTGDQTLSISGADLTISGSGGNTVSLPIPVSYVSSINARTGAVTLTKNDVGLTNVTNDAQLKSTMLDTDGTLAANNDNKIASQKAVKTYVDTNAGRSSFNAIAGEALSQWNVVGVNASGIVKADAASALTAIGYVDAAVSSAATAKVLLGGVVEGATGLLAGKPIYLDASGGITQTLPTSGTLQRLGSALSATTWAWDPQTPVRL